MKEHASRKHPNPKVRPPVWIRWLYRRGIWRTNAADSVSVTFDDGPGPPTEAILGWARDHRVQLGFFLLPEMAKAAPSLVRCMAREGHVIGSHFWQHSPKLLKRKVKFQMELQRSVKVIEEISEKSLEHCRPPYGWLFPWQEKWMTGLGLTPVYWTLNMEDYRPLPLDKTLRRLELYLRPGDIVVMHDGKKHHPEVLRILNFIVENLGYGIRFP